MKRSFQCLSLALVLLTGTQAQNDISKPVKKCATETPSGEWDTWFNQKVEEYKQNIAAHKVSATSQTIPVIVHVIYGSTNTDVGTYPNLSQAQIASQIDVLNADFAGTGFNVGNLASTAFSTVGAADCNIRFCLAQLDPNGNFLPEPGIDRLSYVANGWSNPASFSSQSAFQGFMNSTVKPATIWDPTRYFNVWISDVSSQVGILGYATFPIGTGLAGVPGNGGANTDGIWVWSRAFGTVGTLQTPNHLGRTTTHEVGHWLGIRHISGDPGGSGDCDATDYCADTPPQRGGFMGAGNGLNYGQPTYPLHATGSNSCSAAPFGNMFMNFMDWVDDPAMYLFTPDQAQRMATAMTNGTYRQSLSASSATMCGLSVTAPGAQFSVANTGCTGAGVELTNQTTSIQPSAYLWSAQPSAAVNFFPNNAAANPTVTFNLPGTYNIVLVSGNAGGSTSYTQSITIDECESGGGVGIATISAFRRSIVLAPNPSAGVIDMTVALKGENKLNVKVNNTLGQQLTEVSFDASGSNKYTLDLNHLANGVYFLTLQNGSEKAVKRIVINR